MSAVETGQMSAVETGQMSAAETGQMSSVAWIDICLVSTNSLDVSEVSIVASQLWQCDNVQVADKRSGSKSTKIAPNGSRMVARSWESTPGHAPAIFSPLVPVPRPKTDKV